MAVRINKGRSLDNINLTPMIDMVFNLLIFFLVATQFADEERELKVVLPSASEAKPLIAKPRELFVNIDADGHIVVDRKQVELDELEAIFRRAAVDNPVNQTVYIRADKRVAFDHVVAVFNVCNKVGIRDYRVTTLDPSASQTN